MTQLCSHMTDLALATFAQPDFQNGAFTRLDDLTNIRG